MYRQQFAGKYTILLLNTLFDQFPSKLSLKVEPVASLCRSSGQYEDSHIYRLYQKFPCTLVIAPNKHENGE